MTHESEYNNEKVSKIGALSIKSNSQQKKTGWNSPDVQLASQREE